MVLKLHTGCIIKRGCLSFCVFLLLTGIAFSQPERVDVKIGVLAKRGAEFCKQRWEPTAAYLDTHIPNHSFTIVPLSFEQIIPAAQTSDLDFILVNSAIFAGLEAVHGASCVATMNNLLNTQQSTEFGGVIFTRADRHDIQTLKDLKGKNFLAVDRQSLGGWLMALREFKLHDIDPDHAFRSLAFAGTHDDVVYGILAGTADAGTVRTDTLERMALENKISLADLHVIPYSHASHASHDDLIHRTAYEQFPYLRSTHLYPEWPFAKLNHTSEQVAKEVARALYAMPASSEAAQAAHIAGWTIPHQYQSVRQCLQDLQVWPYEDLGKIHLADVVKKYWLFLLSAALLLSASLLVSFYIVRLNRALRLSQQSLQKSFNRQAISFDQIIDESLNETYIFDATSLQFLRVNQGAQKNLGYDAVELSLMTPVDIKPDYSFESFLTEMEPLITHQEERLIFETRHQRKDGSTYPVEVHLQPSSYRGRKVYVAIILDITARKQAEKEKKELQEQLQQAQKMEAIGTLAGGIAHDFNNILGVILGYLEMSQLQLDTGKDLRKNLEQISQATNRAVELVKQILTFSRKADYLLHPLNPQLITKEALKMLRSSLPSSVELQERIDPQCPPIMADPTNIHQVVLNLCTNAFHALDQEKGLIAVSLSRKELGPEEISDIDVTPGPFVELMVQDTGHGIEPEALDRIFDPYFTTKEKGKGTGLGLAVIYGIVKDCRGFIQVDSTPGQGTTFRIYIPALTEAKVSDEKKARAAELPTGRERVLVVDDEPSIVTLLTTMLNQLGYQTEGSTASLEALSIFRADPNRFDLVISDQTMPKMTGGELAREVFSIRPGLPIILCSGYSSILKEEEALPLGIKNFLKKPVRRETLAYAVREALDNG